MTILSSYQVIGGRIVPRSVIQARALVKYPGSVVGSNGITASVASGSSLQVGRDDGSVATSTSIGTSFSVVIYNEAANTYRRVATTLFGSGSTASIGLPISLVSDVSGTLQAANFGALTGDVTNSAGSYATTIAVNAVTSGKFRQSVGLSVVANRLTATANVGDVSATITGTVLQYDTAGGVLAFGQVATAGLANNAVTDAKLRTATSFSVIGNSTSGSAATVADISGIINQVLRINDSGTVLGFGAISLATSASVSGTLVTSAVPAFFGDVTNSAGSVTTTIATNAVSSAKFRQSVGLSVVGNMLTTTANVSDISGTANQALRIASDGLSLGFGPISLATSASITGTLLGASFPALLGDVTSAGGSLTTTIASNAVTYAKMQDVSATSRIIARKTAGSGDPEECTLSDVMDFVGSPAQGDILYRGAAAWTRLGAGTSGQFLQTTGGGGNPVWASPSGSGDMLKANNLGDIANNATGTYNLGLTSEAHGPLSLAISASAASSALTVSLKTFAGADPAAGSASIVIGFHAFDALSGTPTVSQLTAATSYTATSGSTFGLASSASFRLWVCGFNDSGTFRLGLAQMATSQSVYPLRDGLASAISGTALLAGTIYAAATIVNKPMRVLGYVEWSPAGITAGSWTVSNMTATQIMGAGVPRPGQIIQVVGQIQSPNDTTGVTSFVMSSVSVSITLSSPANMVKLHHGVICYNTAGDAVFVQASRGVTANTNMIGSMAESTNVAVDVTAAALLAMDRPNTASLRYGIQFKSTSGGAQGYGNASPAQTVLEEIMT